VLDHSAFGFKYDKGWEDYFIPFCESYQPSMEDQVEIHCDPDTNKSFLGKLRKQFYCPFSGTGAQTQS
jgi:hypothetical protein